MSRNTTIGIIAVLILGLGGWFLLNSQRSQAPSSQSSPNSTESVTSSDATEEAQVSEEKNMVSITAASFSPKDITIKVGESVTWENVDSANHTVNSDTHPTHTLYPFLNVGMIKPGESKTVMFEKAGKYTYHDHLNPSLTGTVTVQ